MQSRVSIPTATPAATGAPANATANRVNRSKRQLLKSAHTWIGITAGAVISVISLAASVTVFRTEIERAMLPHAVPTASTPKRVSLDEAARAVMRLRPDSHLRRVSLPLETGAPYIFQIESGDKQTERVAADGLTGRVLGTVQSGWVDWMVDLHRNLLSGKPGRATVGAFGVVLFVMSVTGILMWLTGARSWRAWVSRPRATSTIRFNYELHRLCGLWAYGFLAVISFTGIGLAWPDTFKQAVQAIAGPSTAIRAPKIKGEALKSLDQYLQAGTSAMPDGVATEMRLPEPGKGPIELRLYRAGDLAPAGNRVYLNPSSAAVLTVDRVADRPLGARFLASLSPIHYGEFGGIPIKALWSLVALMPLLLFVTGVITWWRRGKKKPLVKAERETATRPMAMAGQ
jgi:uncharacterized iron-regulated membrane protein